MSDEKSIADGGCAFPVPFGEPGEVVQRGMSLRDWFAGRELLTDFDDPKVSPDPKMCKALAGPQPADTIEALRWEATWRARIKFMRADAMIAAGKAKP